MDALGKVDGVKEVKLGRNKFFYEVRILENKSLLPAQLRKIEKALARLSFDDTGRLLREARPRMDSASGT